MIENSPEGSNSSSTPLGEGLEQRTLPQPEGGGETLEEYQKRVTAEAKIEVLELAAEGVKCGEILMDAVAEFMERAERMRETLEGRYGREKLLAPDNDSPQAQAYRRVLAHLDEAKRLGGHKVSLQQAKEIREKLPAYEITVGREVGWLAIAGIATGGSIKNMKEGIARINEMRSDLAFLSRELPPIEAAR